MLIIAACACMKSSSKNDHAAPAASGTSNTSVHGTTSAPSPVQPSIAPADGGPRIAIRINSVADARAAVGKHVHLEGTSDNAKLGAVVVNGDLVVYCIDRKDGWDERNVPVIVEGMLDYTSRTVAPAASAGRISAGTGEPVFQMTCHLVR